MSIYVTDISVVFIKCLLLFTFNLGAYSANAMVRQNSKVEGMAMLSMTTPGIDYGLYDYHMPVIYYNTVTM